MSWLGDHWQQLHFNRLDFDRHFVVDQVISEKPRSRVLLVRRRGETRQTIMKLSDPAASNPATVECLSTLRHPGIAVYLGHGMTVDRHVWLQMEYFDGDPMSAWRQDRWAAQSPAAQSPAGDGVDDDWGAGVFLQLLSVVQYMHCCGWLHGDLSPQNVLVSPDRRRIQLIDFEYARAIDRDSHIHGPRRHSLAYASPQEQAGGITTESCEQYALGKIGRWMIRPFKDDALAEVKAVLAQASAAEPQDRCPDLRTIAQVVDRFTNPARVPS